MNLAKPFFDVGITIRDLEAVAPFWTDTVGAAPDHILPISGDHVQHRYDLYGSVLKLNLRPTRYDIPPSGYRELFVARDGIMSPRPLADPEGNRVTLVPPGYRGVHQIGLRICVRNIEAHSRFLTEALGLVALEEGAFQAGSGMIFLDQDKHASGDSDIEGLGLRYTTFQVYDVREAYRHFLAAGGSEGLPMQQLRDVARYVMVRDPDGNWIELSQRASLTGPLGD